MQPDKENIAKRFKILLLLSIILIATNLFTVFVLQEIYWIDRSSWLLIGIVSFWLFLDSEMLQFIDYYLGCLCLAIILVGVGFLTKSIHPNISIVSTAWSMSSLTLLLVQWPSRKLYLLLFDREPEIEFDTGKFVDIFYSMILYFSAMLIPILIMEWIK